MKIKYFKDYNLKQELQSIEKSNTYFAAHFKEEKLAFLVQYFEEKAVATLFLIDTKTEIASILNGNNTIEGRTIKFQLPKKQFEKGVSQEQVLFYTPAGEFQYTMEYWIDANDRCVKEITLDADGLMTYGQRFYFDTNDELRYCFEYNGSGQLFNCFDLFQGESVRYNNLDLSDSEKDAYKTLN